VVSVVVEMLEVVVNEVTQSMMQMVKV